MAKRTKIGNKNNEGLKFICKEKKATYKHKISFFMVAVIYNKDSMWATRKDEWKLFAIISSE